MVYTKELFERLTKYRGNMYSACYLDYARLNNYDDKKELAEIYKLHFKKDSGILSGCSRCLLRDLRELGKLYFQDEKEYKELEPSTKSIENQSVINKEEKTATNNVKKKKRGRPRKV